MTVLFSNFAETTLAAAAPAGATTLTLAAGTGGEFPSAASSSDPFFLVVLDASNNYEVMRCTGRAGDVLTVERAKDNTSARSWAAGDTVSLRPLAGAFEEMQANAGVADGSITRDKLDTDLQERIDNSVKIADGSDPTPKLGADNDAIEFISANESTTQRVNLRPVVEKFVEPFGLKSTGNAAKRAAIVAVMAGATEPTEQLDYDDLKNTPTLPGEYDDAALTGRVDQLEGFEDALRENVTLANAVRIVVSTRNVSYEVTGAKAPTDAADDRELRFTLEVAGDDDIVFTVDLVDLRAKTPIVEANRAMNDANSVSYVVGTHTYRIGRDTSENFYFGTSAGATYLVTIVDRRVRFKPEMLASGTPDNTKFPRGDGVWAVPVGTGQGIAASAVRAFAKEATSAAAVRQGVVTAMDSPAQDSERLDFLDLKNQPPAVRDFAKTTATAAAVRQGIVTAMDSPAQDSERLSYNDLKDKPTIPSGGGGSSSEIPAGSALPAVADADLGDLFNLNGVLYELVGSSVDPHVYRGTLAALSGGYRGDATFSWLAVNPFTIRAFFSKAVLGASPPASLYVQFDRDDGEHVVLQLNRFTNTDTSSLYAYQAIQGVGIDSGTVGQAFAIRVFTDYDQANPVRIQSATANRWEPDNRDIPVNPIALQGNTNYWPADKLGYRISSTPSDVPLSRRFLNSNNEFVPVPFGPGRTVFREELPSLVLSRTDADAFVAAPVPLDPRFDLGLTENRNGVFHLSLLVKVAPVSDANMGFLAGGANQTLSDRERLLSSEVFSTRVRALDDFATTSVFDDINGIPANRLTLYSGPTIAGIFTFMVVKNTVSGKSYADVYYHFDGRAGATGATLSLTLDAVYASNDVPDGPEPSDGAGQGFMLTVPNAAAKNFTTGTDATDPTDGDWSAWTNILTSRALTAAEVGNLLLVGHVHVETNADPTDGGDRIITESRIRRTRGADTVTVSDDLEYGPRNVGGTLPANFRDASQISDKNLVVFDEAETGDVYSLEVRAISQQNARRVDIAVAGNWLGIAQLGGGAGGGGGGGVEELFNLGIEYDSSDVNKGAIAGVPYALPAFSRELTEADDDKSLVLDLAGVTVDYRTTNFTHGQQSFVFRAGDIRALAADAPPSAAVDYAMRLYIGPYRTEDTRAGRLVGLDKNADGRLVLLSPSLGIYLRHARCRLVGGGGGGAATSGPTEEELVSEQLYTGSATGVNTQNWPAAPAFSRELVEADDAKMLWINLDVVNTGSTALARSASLPIQMPAGAFRKLTADAPPNANPLLNAAFAAVISVHGAAAVTKMLIDKNAAGRMTFRSNEALYLRYLRVRLVG